MSIRPEEMSLRANKEEEEGKKERRENAFVNEKELPLLSKWLDQLPGCPEQHLQLPILKRP